ncbi:MAG: clostripain-related cysteine peptidase, partial [Firmicutes bacterium]|nr:clostripain-related cysteine peptidase [Bacillota bacterium]
LTLPEFKEAIEAVPAAAGVYEAVGFDACLMATVDIVDILRGDARYLVASEEVEPGIGWDYTGLFSALAKNTAIDGAALGRTICDTYYATCAEFGEEGEITLSVTDIGRAQALLEAFRGIGDEALLLAVEEQQAFLSAFGRAARDAETYAGGNVEMLDLGDLVTHAGSLLPKNGKTLLDALKGCVTYQVKGPYRSKASGLACYYNLSGDPESTAAYLTLGTNMAYAYFHDYAVRGALSEEAQAYVTQQQQPAPGPAPLPQAGNLKQRLDNFPVSVGSDGRWRMDLGPELASNLATVLVKLMYVSPGRDGGEGFRVLWGTNRDLRADYQKGLFVEDFADTWGSIDGWNVHMEPIGIEEGRILYAVPILLNSTTGGMGEWKADEEYSLHVGCAYDAGGNREYEILGAWKSGEAQRGVASKTLHQLQPGDVIEPLHYPMLRDDRGELYIDYPPMGMGLLTVDEYTVFYDKSVGDGYYALLFEMIDYAGNHYFSQEASLRVRNGRIERLPGGIAPATTTQPPDTINGYYLSKASFTQEGLGREIVYYTIIIDAERYEAIAGNLGLPAGSDSGGEGYTIQIYSDTFSLDPYVGMQQVYFKGECFAANTINHRLDIVCDVESITEVW